MDWLIKDWQSRAPSIFLSVILCLPLGATCVATASDHVLDDLSPYPVLILTGDNRHRGSGFYLDTGKDIFLITARHVVYDKDRNELFHAIAYCTSLPADRSVQHKHSLQVNLQALLSSGNLKEDAAQDILVARLAHGIGKNLPFLEGVKADSLNKSSPITFLRSLAKGFDETSVGDEILKSGYPDWKKVNKQEPSDRNAPASRRGHILEKNEKASIFILDLPTYPGESGGPVVSVKIDGGQMQFQIVGVILQSIVDKVYKPTVDRGFDFSNPHLEDLTKAVSMDPVLNLVESFASDY